MKKKLWRDPLYPAGDKLKDEAADVFIALINYCNSRGIDLESAVQEKLIEIEKRRLMGKMGETK